MTLKETTTTTTETVNDLGNTPAAQQQMDTLAADHDAQAEVDVDLTDTDLQIDETELETVLKDAAATVEKASAETVAATQQAQEQAPPKPQPKPLTVTQEAAVAAFGGLTDMLVRYDQVRNAVERISGEMRDLRIALDSFEPTALIHTTVAGIQIPMTANAVLEAKRVELARAMDYMRELALMTSERSEAMAEASYLDLKAERDGVIAPPRRNPTRGPIIRERAPDPTPPQSEPEVNIEAGIADVLQERGVPVTARDDDPVPPFLTKGPRHFEEPQEQPGLLKRMAGRLTGRNSG